MKFKHQKTKKGMSIIEVVISVALIAILLIPISNTVVSAKRKSEKAIVNQKITSETQKVLEEINSYDKIQFNSAGDFTLLDGNVIHYNSSTNEITGNYPVKNDGYDVNIEIKGSKNTNLSQSKPATATALSYDAAMNIYKDSYVSFEGANKVKNIDNKMIVNIGADNSYSCFLDANPLGEPLKGIQLGATKIGTNQKRLLINLPKDNDGYKGTMDIAIYSKAVDEIFIDVVKGTGVTGKVNVILKEQKNNISCSLISTQADINEIGDVFSFDITAKTKTKLYDKLGNDVEFTANTIKNVVVK